jgi:hypothetical protein
VLYITNDLFDNLVTVNGSKLTDDNKTYLSADIYITGIEIGTSNIRISYTIDEVVQDIDTTIDWRVR